MDNYGIFNGPVPSTLSELINDGMYLSAREYSLSELSSINDIGEGSIITKITLTITKESFSIFEVKTDSGVVLFSDAICDPSIAGVYTTECYYQVNNTDEIVFTWDPTSGGEGKVCIELYETVRKYVPMVTSANEEYNTTDNQTVNVED